MINNKVFTSLEMPEGEFLAFDKDTFSHAREAGYKGVLAKPQKTRKAFRDGIPLKNVHWHPDARLVHLPASALETE